jgi:hypothetical protein
MVWYGMAQYSMVWYGMVWYGTVQYSTVQYGMVWYGTVHVRQQAKCDVCETVYDTTGKVWHRKSVCAYPYYLQHSGTFACYDNQIYSPLSYPPDDSIYCSW